MPELLTVRDCAAELRVSTKTVYRAIGAGALRAHRVGQGLRISRRALEAYLDARATSTDEGRGDA